MLFVRKYDPQIHHRRSIRLKGYDYSKAGRYFVTICCHDRMCRFGRIENYEMILNDAGKMIDKWFLELPRKFPDVALGTHVVMPNHFHAIIINTGKYPAVIGNDPVGADLRVRPDNNGICPDINVRPDNEGICHDNEGVCHDIGGEHKGSPLPRVVQWFKTMTTNDYIRGVKKSNWERFDGKLWQRNYYEHIIRDEKSYIAISNYIIGNPSTWVGDQFYNQ